MRLSLGDEAFKAIGKVTAYFSMLEEEVDLGVEVLMLSPSQHARAVLLSKFNFARKIDVFRELYRGHFGESQELDGLYRRLRKAGEDRNRVIHSLWAGGFGEHPLIRVPRPIGRAKRVEVQKIEITELEKLVEEIGELAYLLLMFIDSLREPVTALIRAGAVANADTGTDT